MSEQGLDEILIRHQGAVGRITLNRPKALNALTLAGVRAIAEALRHFETNSELRCVVLDAAGGKSFCAGGDIRSIYDSINDRTPFAETFWREEYALNARIKHYTKPFIALMDGIVMGGGVGLSAHGSHRIVTERTRLAMPEVGIGFVPDVGGLYLLARAPGETGTFMALTGDPVDASDAIYTGFADAYVASSRLPALIDALTDLAKGEDPASLITRHAERPSPGALERNRAFCDQHFSHDQVEDILASLDSEESNLARATAATIRKRSPLSLKTALAALRHEHRLTTLEDSLRLEFRIALRALAGNDFREGIRAVVIDKDNAPKWQPATLEETPPALVEAMMAPLGERELSL